MKKYVTDTSVLINGEVSKMLINNELSGEIIIPEPSVAELEAQANFGKISGFQGLEEISRIRRTAEEKGHKVTFKGERPTIEHIRMAKGGEIDNLIRKIADEESATLITSDRVQYQVAVARGIEAMYLMQERIKPEDTKIMSFFSEGTSSVHLRDGIPPYAKRGEPGRLRLEKIREGPVEIKELQQIAHEILEAARQDGDSSIEIERNGATVVQLRDLRIAIAEWPFSDRMEITAVRPIAKLSIDEYGVSEELKRRFIEKQRGILISGPPGAGKSTFAASVANYLLVHGFMVKTMESPRDLMVGEEITQYAPLEGDMRNTADLLLLVRPDYTIYDELRRTSDFQVFADMRLAGVGMIGVTHATRAIDAVQRMIGRVELGVIPQVVDTIIFIDGGELRKVYELHFTVKVPEGMFEADLARPVIEVSDFETQKPEYEVYTYGEQIVVMPVEKEPKDYSDLQTRIAELVSEYIGNFEIDVLNERKAIIRTIEENIPILVGKKGRTIKKIEDILRMSLDVYPMKTKERRPVDVSETQKHWVIHAEGLEKKMVNVYAAKIYLLTASVGSKGVIRVRKKTDIGKKIARTITAGEAIYVEY